MKDPRARFGPALRNAREQCQLTQAVLAQRSGMTHSMISRLESSSRFPSRKAVIGLAQALQLDPAGRESLLGAAGFLDDESVEFLDVGPIIPAHVDPFLNRFMQLLNDNRVSDDLVMPMLDRIDEFIERAEHVIGRSA